jgi:hypothetical protein
VEQEASHRNGTYRSALQGTTPQKWRGRPPFSVPVLQSPPTLHKPNLPVPGGAFLLEVFLLVPIVSIQTLNVAVPSYAGQLNLTAVSGADTCPDLNVSARGMRATLQKLAPAVTHDQA